VIDWTARARAELATNPAEGTAGTDESQVTSVSSAPSAAVDWNQLAAGVVSSVSSVPPLHVPANDDVGPCDAVKPARRSGNPYMTPEQGDECHEGGWDDAEIEVFLARSKRLSARYRADAEHLAERLTLRDRQADDRRMCLECRELEAGGRCAAARRGALTSTARRFEPTQNILMRCPAFRSGDPHHP
jgi:hypothetical protein